MAKKKEEQAGPSDDLLADVTAKTTKAQLLGKLREAVRRLHGREDERVGRMQELEEKVRARFTGVEPDIRSVTVMCTPEEFVEMSDFLDNFEDIMPMALHRLQAGAKFVTQNHVQGDQPAS